MLTFETCPEDPTGVTLKIQKVMQWRKGKIIYVCVCALVVQGSLNPAFNFYIPCKGDLFASHPLKSESLMSEAPQWAWVSDALWLLRGRGMSAGSMRPLNSCHICIQPHASPACLSLSFPLGRFKIRIRMDIQPDSYCTQAMQWISTSSASRWISIADPPKSSKIVNHTRVKKIKIIVSNITKWPMTWTIMVSHSMKKN